MAPSAATRVFGITELAEAIFDQLEMHDLVRVTRISRTINSTIYGSKKFKQTLFLEPKAIHAELVTEEIGPISGDFDILYTIVYSEAEEEGAHVIATLNPFLGSSSQTAVDFTCIRCTIDPDYLLERVERGGTHCELMFVTQPPAKEIELEYTSQVSFKDGSTRSDECKHTTTVRCGGGVRIGDLAKSLKDILEQKSRRSGLQASFSGKVDIIVWNFVADDSPEVLEAHRNELKATVSWEAESFQIV